MTVNRYDQASITPYIEQYTPIPFDTLYRLGREYNDQVDEAMQQMADYNKNWRQFTSPITQDIADYYSIAMNPTLRGLVEEAAGNPDALRSFSFRGRLQNAINSVDYAKLGQLQQSAENARAYQEEARKMAARGEYNPNWDAVDFTRYRTLNQGVFSELAPIQFQTLQSIVDPYVKNLEPTFYGGVDPLTGTRMPYTNWMAVTDNEINKALQARYMDIVNTPQGQMWYRDIASQVLQANPAATAEQIDQAFMGALSAAASQYVHSEPLTDQVGLAMYRESRADARKRMEIPESTTVPLTETLTNRGNQLYNAFSSALFSQLAMQNPQQSAALDQINKDFAQAKADNDQNKMNEAANRYTQLRSKAGYGISDYVGYLLDKGKDKNGYVTDKQLNQNISAVASYLTIPYESQNMVDAITQAMPNVIRNENTDFGEALVTSNVGDYNLLKNTVMSIGGRTYTSGSPTERVQQYLKNNNIRSYVTGTRGYMTTGAGNINITTQAIKEEDLLPLARDKKGNPYNPYSTDADHIRECKEYLQSLLPKAGFRKTTPNRVTKITTSADYNEDNPQGKSSGTISTAYSGGGTYWEADFTNTIPQTGDMSAGVDINNYYDRLSLGQTGARETFGTRQSQADRAANYNENN